MYITIYPFKGGASVSCSPDTPAILNQEITRVAQEYWKKNDWESYRNAHGL